MKNVRYYRFIGIFAVILLLVSCGKLNPNDPRNNYTGDWNFKGNGFSFSGYYNYNVPPGESPQYVMNTNSWTDYNDSTGRIRKGKKSNELIVNYCSTCPDVVYIMEENGMGKWTLTSTTFYDDIQPNPPGYTSYYQTYNIEGWKL
jgi:hypothetical protein